VLGVGSVGPSKLFSKRVVETLRELPLLQKKVNYGEVRIVAERSRCKLKPPEYFYANLTSRVPVDIEASHSTILRQCAACGRILKLKSVPAYPVQPDLRQWDGTPLFEMGYSRVRALYCSEEIKGLAEQEGWRNFEFMLVPVKESL